jgi:hypothetical protein
MLKFRTISPEKYVEAWTSPNQSSWRAAGVIATFVSIGYTNLAKETGKRNTDTQRQGQC